MKRKLNGDAGQARPRDVMPSAKRMRILDKAAAPICVVVIGLAMFVLDGCITHPWNPAATQPATEIDPVTTQPSYYLDRPAVVEVHDGSDYHHLWLVCEEVMRDYLFTLDREDYRDGTLTTVPLVSRQLTEFWRPDTGTFHDMVQNSITTMRRTLYLQFSRNDDNTYTITPKVLVERQSILERRITDQSQYHQLFAGPLAPAMFSVKVAHDVPLRYWTPVGRDTVMEKQVAAKIEQAIHKSKPS